MIILGINAYHPDSSACLLRDGELVAAAEEERFRRIKHWAGFPSHAVAYCLKEAGLRLADLTCVAVNRNNRANLARKIAYVATHRPNLKLVLQRLRNRSKWGNMDDELARAFPDERFGGEIKHVEHHFAHLASAFYASHFSDALAVSVDGFGDFASAAWGAGQGTRLALDGRILFPHSLGVFYRAMTQYLGFPQFGDEYKVMGLAPYGDGSLVSKVRQLVSVKSDGAFALNLEYFRHHREDIVYEWEAGSPESDALFSKQVEELLGPARATDAPLTDRHRNIAFATQAVFEEAFFALLTSLRARYGIDKIVLSGWMRIQFRSQRKVVEPLRFQSVLSTLRSRRCRRCNRCGLCGMACATRGIPAAPARPRLSGAVILGAGNSKLAQRQGRACVRELHGHPCR